jgi:hypothetical protein
VRTVERHVANLSGKLGAANRAEAAVIAVRRGLAAPGPVDGGGAVSPVVGASAVRSW